MFSFFFISPQKLLHKLRAASLPQPTATNLQYAWIIAVWTPVFTEFLHEHLLGLQQGRLSANIEQAELAVGHVFQAAIQHGLTIQSVQFPDRSYLDIGTPNNLIKAVHDQQFFKEIQP